MDTTTPATSKSWYQSKIVLFCLVAIATIGSNLLNGWLTGQGVTDDQFNVVSATQPAIANAIEQMKQGQTLLQVGGSVIFSIIAVVRVWFTNKTIQLN